MSVKAMSWVWDNADAKGADLLVLLALADAAHDDGTKAYPGRKRLSEKTRMSERQVIRICNRLVERGLIEHVGQSHLHTNEYRIVGVGHVPDMSTEGGDILAPLKVTTRDKGGDRSDARGDIEGRGGDKTAPGGDIAMSSNPSLEPSFDPSSNPSGGLEDFEVLEGVYRSLYGRGMTDGGRAYAKAMVITFGLPRSVNALRGEYDRDTNPATIFSRMEKGLKNGNQLSRFAYLNEGMIQDDPIPSAAA